MGRLEGCRAVCLRSDCLLMECRYYRKLEGGNVECQLCPHHCHIADGKTGICRSRRNHGGVLMNEVYGKPCALAIDPIEKKPLYHFHPGTTCLSLACTGCNFRCQNCQNHDISQAAPDAVNYYELSPEKVVALCKKHKCPGIAYTYTPKLVPPLNCFVLGQITYISVLQFLHL